MWQWPPLLALAAVGCAGLSQVPASRSAGAPTTAAVPSALRSVCKVYVTVVEPDYAQPWSVFAEDEAVGSGFIVEDDGRALRVITNAHVVKWSTEIRVRRHGETRRYRARLVGISHEADLALLAVDDVEFWRPRADGQPVLPLRWAEALPELYADVAVVGYPLGGDNVCVTRGVVSRVDAMAYTRGAPALLVVQIDAAVNSGNSGGPCLAADGAVLGLAFSGMAGSADNIGYVIPESVARTFLAECAAQRYRRDTTYLARVALCSLGVSVQPCENDALRASLRLGDASGVLVTRVAKTSCAVDALAPGDVLLAVGGLDIADDGTVELRPDQRVDLAHAATSRRPGETTRLDVLRDGARISADVTFAPLDRLVPVVDDADRPAYLVLGGLVLMRLTLPLLEAEARYRDEHDDRDDIHGGRDVDSRLLALHANHLGLERSDDEAARRELVVWTSTLSHDANFGYSDHCRDLPVLTAFCGQPVESLAHLAALVDDADELQTDFYVLDFAPPNPRPGDIIKVVLDADQTHQANDDILRIRGLPALASPDVIEALHRHRTAKNDLLSRAGAPKPLPSAPRPPRRPATARRSYGGGHNSRGRRAR